MALEVGLLHWLVPSTNFVLGFVVDALGSVASAASPLLWILLGLAAVLILYSVYKSFSTKPEPVPAVRREQRGGQAPVLSDEDRQELRSVQAVQQRLLAEDQRAAASPVRSGRRSSDSRPVSASSLAAPAAQPIALRDSKRIGGQSSSRRRVSPGLASSDSNPFAVSSSALPSGPNRA